MGTLVKVAVLCLVLGVVSAGRGWPFRSGRGGQKPEINYEKLFFCKIARIRRVCLLDTVDADPLISRTCKDDSPCNGPSGTVGLNDTDYTIQFCPIPEEQDFYQRLIDRDDDDEDESEEPSEELKAICSKPERGGDGGKGDRPERRNRKPLWYYMACEVTADGDIMKQRNCLGDAECNQGPYDAQLNDTDVKVKFCNRSLNLEEKEAFWERLACSIVKQDGETVKKENCPGNVACTVRLTNFDYEETKVDIGVCDRPPRLQMGKKIIKKISRGRLQIGKKIKKLISLRQQKGKKSKKTRGPRRG